MTRTLTLLIGVALTASSLAAPATTASAPAEPIAVLLEKGIYQEETAGDLDAAMKIYQQIVEQSAANRQAIAQAHYRLGMCLLKKGDKAAAVAQLDEVIKHFSDQKDLAAKAQAARQNAVSSMSEKDVAATVEAAVTDISTRAEGDAALAKDLESLKGLSDKAVVKSLSKWLESDKNTIRRATIYILWKGEFSNIDAAGPGLTKLLSHEEDFTRGMAALALGGKKVSSSIDALIEMTLHDQSPYARRCAVYALGLMGDPKAKPAVEQALKDSDPQVHNNAEAASTMLAKSQDSSEQASTGDDQLKAKLINWVEKFFSGNFRDVTARKTLSWGSPKVEANGNLSITYKYLGTIWNKDKLIIEQKFTFTPEGKYVSAETVEKSPASQPGADPFTEEEKKNRIVDKIDYPFVDDPAVVGRWEGVAFVPEIDSFVPGIQQDDLYLKELVFNPRGTTAKPWWTWTKGLLLHHGDKTASKYEIKEIDGTTYMFLEWKSGDYVIRHQKPEYYVLKRVASTSAPAAGQDKLKAEDLGAEAWKLWQQRKLSEAEDKFKQAVALDPTASNSWNGLGWAQFNQGKKANAKVSFEKAVAIEPKQVAALNGLGWIAKADGDVDKAIEYWQKAVEINPAATAPLNGLAQIYMERGAFDKAIEAYQTWLKGEPDNADAKAGLKKVQDAAEAVKAAVPVAQEWVKLVDDGQYGQSWDAAAEFFRKAMAKPAWEQVVGAVRKPLGKLQSRKMLSSTFATSLPGVPDGQYVIVRFQTDFENKKQAVETITPMKGEDGKWRVSGYFIK